MAPDIDSGDHAKLQSDHSLFYLRRRSLSINFFSKRQLNEVNDFRTVCALKEIVFFFVPGKWKERKNERKKKEVGCP